MNLLKLLLILRLISIEGVELLKICPGDSCEDFELIGRLSR